MLTQLEHIDKTNSVLRRINGGDVEVENSYNLEVIPSYVIDISF